MGGLSRNPWPYDNEGSDDDVVEVTPTRTPMKLNPGTRTITPTKLSPVKRPIVPNKATTATKTATKAATTTATPKKTKTGASHHTNHYAINHERSIHQYLFRAPSTAKGGPGSKAFRYKAGDGADEVRALSACKTHARAMCRRHGVAIPATFL